MQNNTFDFYREYKTSISEMNRRKTAFLTLSASLFISVCISALIILPVSFNYYLAGMAMFGLFLVISVLSFNSLFEHSKKIKISISAQQIERTGLKKREKCSIDSITSMRIKRTAAKKIREIRITRTRRSPIYINGVDNFDELTNHLLLLLGNTAKIHDTREPIDFDHPLFYVFFGTLTGTMSIIALNFGINMKPDDFQIARISIACFIFFVGIYWFITRPVTARYDKSKSIHDYVIILFLVLTGIAMIAL